MLEQQAQDPKAATSAVAIQAAAAQSREGLANPTRLQNGISTSPETSSSWVGVQSTAAKHPQGLSSLTQTLRAQAKDQDADVSTTAIRATAPQSNHFVAQYRAYSHPCLRFAFPLTVQTQDSEPLWVASPSA